MSMTRMRAVALVVLAWCCGPTLLNAQSRPEPAYMTGYLQPTAYTAPPPPGYEPSVAVPALGVSWENYSLLEQRLDSLEQTLKDQKSGSAASSSKPTVEVSGRVHFDYWPMGNSSPLANYLESTPSNASDDPEDFIGFRRLRFGVAGDINETMNYKIEMDFATPADPAIKDAYLGWNELPFLHTVLLGNQKRPTQAAILNVEHGSVFDPSFD